MNAISAPNVYMRSIATRRSHTEIPDAMEEVLDVVKAAGYDLVILDVMMPQKGGVAVYNEMRRRRPDLVALLFDPIATDRRGEVPVGERPFFEIPVLSWHEGYLTGMYQRQYIDSAQRFPKAMRLTDAHVEALDLFDEIANNPKLCLGMQLQPGDIQFVHNHSLLHDRTGFRDWPDPKDRRHLLRLWLSVPGDRPLPDSFRQRFGSINAGDRGGIITHGTELNVPLD